MERLTIITGLCVLFVLSTCSFSPAHADASIVSGVGVGVAVGRLAFLVAGATVGIGGAIFIGFVAGAVTSILGRPSRPNDISGAGIQTRIEPISSRKAVYGQARVGGPIVFAYGTENNRVIHLVIPVASHEIHSFDSFFVGGEHIIFEPPDATGLRNAVGPGSGAYGTTSDPRERFHDHLFIETFTGADDQPASVNLQNAVGSDVWNAGGDTTKGQHRLRGVAYFYARLVYDNEVYPTSIPNLSCVIKGKKVLDPRSPTAPRAWTDNAALCLLDYMTDDDYGLGASMDEIDGDSFISGANLSDELAVPLNSNIPGNRRVFRGTSDTLDPLTFLRTNPTPDQRNGVIPAVDYMGEKSYVNTGDYIARASLSDTRVSGGIIFSGLNLFAISDGAGGFSLATSLANARAGIPITLNATARATPHVSLDNTFGPSEYQHSGELRYTINGVVDSATSPEDVISGMLISQNAEMPYVGGRFVLVDSSTPSSVLNITEKLVIDDVNVSPKIGYKNFFNAVRGTHLFPQEAWMPAPFDPVEELSPDENQGRAKYTNIGLPFTISPDMARRIAGQYIRAARSQESVQLTTSLEGLKARVGDVVNLTLSDFGWSNAPFRVVGFQLVEIQGVGRACKFDLKQIRTIADPETHTFRFGPSTNLPDAFSSVLPPTALRVRSGSADLHTNGDGTIAVGMLASWIAPANGFAQSYELGYRVHDDDPANANVGWTTDIIPDSSTSHEIVGVSDGVEYDVRIRSVSAQNIKSAYLLTTHVVIGKQQRPPDITATSTGLSISTLRSGERRFSFSQTDWPPDVRVGGGILIRYSSDLNALWENMTDLRDVFRASPYETPELPGGRYRFAAKLVDSTGNESLNPYYRNATIGPQNLGPTLVQRDERDLGWPGTLGTNTRRLGQELIAVGGADDRWSRMPEPWSANTEDWADSVYQSNSVQYSTPVIDLGSNLAFTPRISTDHAGAAPVITLRYGDAITGTGSAQTITSPSTQTITSGLAGSPITARYIQVSVSVAPVQSARTNAVLKDLDLILTGDSARDFYDSLNTAGQTGTPPGFTRIAQGHFSVAHRTGAAVIQEATPTAIHGNADELRIRLVGKTVPTSGPPIATFKMYNQSGALTDAIIDILLVGPRSGAT